MSEHPLGFGVMLSLLSGNKETVQAHQQARGKTIETLRIDGQANYGSGALVMRFTDGTGIMVFDDGQSCCEHRYMTTDDDLSGFAGATFLGLELRGSPAGATEWGDVHEVQFLLGHTSLGTFTAETHNEHNGWYGGFAITIRDIED